MPLPHPYAVFTTIVTVNTDLDLNTDGGEEAFEEKYGQLYDELKAFEASMLFLADQWERYLRQRYPDVEIEVGDEYKDIDYTREKWTLRRLGSS